MSKDPEKQELRKEVWEALRSAGAARFPGARGRIPNFKGAEKAAERLSETTWFRRAQVLKCNPDSPQRRVRHLALKAGKRVYMAVPRLAEAHPFLLLDPEVLGERALWEASSIKGASVLGRPIALEDVEPIDLIVTGCVATSRRGERLGKGGGYSDLEYALLRQAGKVKARTPVVSTVHPVQLLEERRIPVRAHDQSLDGVVTPEEVIRVVGRPRRAGRILWPALEPEKIEAIPVLERLRP